MIARASRNGDSPDTAVSDCLLAVTEDYKERDNKFTGKIRKVTVEVK